MCDSGCTRGVGNEAVSLQNNLKRIVSVLARYLVGETPLLFISRSLLLLVADCSAFEKPHSERAVTC